MKKSEFKQLIREEVKNVLTELAKPISLKGKHGPGSVVLALFFDHTKQSNNSKELWARIIEFAGDPEINYRLVQYFVTDSVVEFEFKPKRPGRYDVGIRAMESNLEEYQNKFTSYDIYTI
jgi:hypothetical protein